jgi:hypothetical protein
MIIYFKNLRKMRVCQNRFFDFLRIAVMNLKNRLGNRQGVCLLVAAQDTGQDPCSPVIEFRPGYQVAHPANY